MTRFRKTVLAAAVFVFVVLLAMSPLLVMLGLAGAFDSWAGLRKALWALAIVFLGPLLGYGMCLTFVDVMTGLLWVLGNLKERIENVVGSSLEKRRRLTNIRKIVAAFKPEARNEAARELVGLLEPDPARAAALVKSVVHGARR